MPKGLPKRFENQIRSFPELPVWDLQSELRNWTDTILLILVQTAGDFYQSNFISSTLRMPVQFHVIIDQSKLIYVH